MPIRPVVMLLGAARAHAAVPPPRRDLAEVTAVLARAPKAPAAREMRPLNMLLVANRLRARHARSSWSSKG